MSEFRSKLEDLMYAEELVFDPTPGFGRWRRFFPEDAIKHPAKANLNLIDFLIDKYTKEGDLILDPMAGTGSTCVLATLKGRDAICVDIEPLFYQWMEKAREIVEKTPMLGRKGRMINILGDARKLSDLLKQIDIIITSPPYADTYKHDKRAENPEAIKKHADMLSIRSGDHHTQGRMRRIQRDFQGYSDNPDNIGNMPLGDIDVIITSPPYESALEGTSRHTRGGIASRDPALAQTETYSTVLSVKQGVPVMYSPNPDNIGNLKSKDEEYKMLEHEKENYINPEVDVIITSPPYAHESTASEPTKLELEGKFKMGHSKEVSYTDDDYRSWDKRFGGNIGKLKMFVRVPASPEEADHVDNRPERKGTLWEYTKEVLVTPENVTEIQGRKRLDRGRGETYVEAMMKVYNEMYKVLKPNGYAIVIIKPFIRNKQVIDLPYYTWLMMKKAGFRLEKIYKLRLETQSFWRILYYKKHPDVPRINHEYIIVCRK